VAGDLAVPFAVSLANYNTLQLPNDQFNFLDIQNQRDVLAEHARKRFQFLQLLNTISYIRLHPEDFIGADLDKLGAQFAKVTDDINVMEREASACLQNPGACQFTPFDVSDFPLPPPKPSVQGTIIVPDWVHLFVQFVTNGGTDQDGVVHTSASALGFRTQIVTVPNTGHEGGTIESTFPPAGTPVPVGTVIVLNVFDDN
jgi:hypothetical protein